ncbi:MAG: DNA repair protein [Chlorobi bacterium OLB4]|nr:MAG: DNA repair protein [Chlorobi bacterium OLB4]
MKIKSQYICQSCGFRSLRWSGKCPECDSWNSMVEEIVSQKSVSPHKKNRALNAKLDNINEITSTNEQRISTNIAELDRVLGGGIVNGSVILIGGDPGIGKSTLMLQIAEKIENLKIIYISGEESARQIKMRSERLGSRFDNFYVLCETDTDMIISIIEKENPGLVIVDSVQTIYTPILESAPGSISQIRESTSILMNCAKKLNLPIIIIGHITKDGSIAGPKVLEHMVDVVLQFEGERTHSFRILRGIKNRFGSTNEIGIFEMTDKGLTEVKNPSEVFLSQRNYGASGCVISSAIEGTRPILIEVQALTATSNYGLPQRTSIGFDYKRLNIIIAVLEKRIGLFLNKFDIFVNIAGGVKIDEPAIDLAIAAGIYSSFKDIPVDSETVVLGEIGLSGEIRTISYIEKRLNEAVKLGFKRIIIPKNNMKGLKKSMAGIELKGVEQIKEAIDLLI